jgi:hypothetical protein
MSATQFGLGLLYIAVAVIWYAAGWWQGRTVERDRWKERAAGQDQLAQLDQQGQGPEVLVNRQPFERISHSDLGSSSRNGRSNCTVTSTTVPAARGRFTPARTAQNEEPSLPVDPRAEPGEVEPITAVRTRQLVP